MKIKLTGSKFRENQGTIVEVANADDTGDVNLGAGGFETYGYTWAFADEYEVVNEGETDMQEEQQFIVTLQVTGIQELAEVLNDLTYEMRETATLTVGGNK